MSDHAALEIASRVPVHVRRMPPPPAPPTVALPARPPVILPREVLTDECRIVVTLDVVDSTRLVERLGDSGGAAVLDRCAHIVRAMVAAHGGTEVRATGDGFVLSFRSVDRALCCALSVRSGLAAHNARHPEVPVRVRTGVHAGEAVIGAEGLHGIVWHKAARLMAQAEPEGILVSDVVRLLAEGKAFEFSDRGDLELRGFHSPVRTHELNGYPAGASRSGVLACRHVAQPRGAGVPTTGNGGHGRGLDRPAEADSANGHEHSTNGAPHPDIRVQVLDDDRLVRESVVALIRRHPGLDVVGDGPADAATIAAVRRDPPDVLVLEPGGPGAIGCETPWDLLGAPETMSLSLRVLVLTAFPDEEQVARALRAGVRGYLLKRCNELELIEGVRAVAAGRHVLDPRISRCLVQGLVQLPGDADPLSVRERQILQLVAEGMSNREIARALGITRKTVETHRARMMRKLRVHRTAGLVRYAIHRGIAGASD